MCLYHFDVMQIAGLDPVDMALLSFLTALIVQRVLLAGEWTLIGAARDEDWSLVRWLSCKRDHMHLEPAKQQSRLGWRNDLWIDAVGGNPSSQNQKLLTRSS